MTPRVELEVLTAAADEVCFIVALGVSCIICLSVRKHSGTSRDTTIGCRLAVPPSGRALHKVVARIDLGAPHANMVESRGGARWGSVYM